MAVGPPNHLLSVLDIQDDLEDIINSAIAMKERFKRGARERHLEGKTLGMIFEKPSTRTRISFETAMTQLGGHAIYMGRGEIHMGEKESIADTGRVLSRYLCAIVYRAYEGKNVRELAAHSKVPVINALDDREHPCQIVADLMTVKEKKGTLRGLRFGWIGDGNNVCNSLILGTSIVGANITVATPGGYEPAEDIVSKAKEIAESTGASIDLVNDPKDAAEDADVLVTDVWISMGDEAEKDRRLKDFEGYQINSALLELADEKAIVMHCLPAMRGYEITDEVMDGPQSVVFDEAENRLHAQKALLVYLVQGELP